MSLGDRLGLAGLIVAFFSIAAFYLFPDRKWIGWLSLVIAAVLATAWGVTEIKQVLSGSKASLLLSIGCGAVLGSGIGWLMWLSASTKEQKGSESANKPDFHIVLYDMALVPWRDDPSFGAVCLIAGVANSGSPSVARSFKISIPRKDGGAFEGSLSSVGSSPWRIQVESANFDVTLRAEDSLPDKTLRSVVPQGGEVTGYILARFPGVPSGKIGALGDGVTVRIEDINGKQYSRHIKPAAALGITPYYPGTRLNDNAGVTSVSRTPVVSIQLMPAVDKAHATSLPVTGALIIFANNRGETLRDFSKLMLLPAINKVTIPEAHKQRLTIISGNKRGSTFLHIAAPELLANEHHFVEVTFLRPQKFTSADAWGRPYGYTGENVMVYRLFIGPEQTSEKGVRH